MLIDSRLRYVAAGTTTCPCAVTHTDQNLLFHDPTELNYNSVSVEQRMLGCVMGIWVIKVMRARAEEVKSCYLCEND